MASSIYVRGEGGTVFEMDPARLPTDHAKKLADGRLVRLDPEYVETRTVKVATGGNDRDGKPVMVDVTTHHQTAEKALPPGELRPVAPESDDIAEDPEIAAIEAAPIPPAKPRK